MRQDHNSRDGLSLSRPGGKNRNQCPRQDTRIHAADLGQAQESICKPGDHESDGIHMGGNHHGWTRALAGTAPKGME